MFSSGSFAKASFSITAFKMAQDTDTARSGYWRLFYYNMQEEALKKDEQVKGKAETESKSESSQAKPIAQPKPKRKPEPVVTEEPIPHLLKPVYRGAVEQPSQEFGDLLRVLRIEFSTWQFTLPILSAKLLATQAANDEEDDIEMLLLAA